jgi:hypothetical protein
MERALTTATVRLAWDHAVGNFWVDTGLVVLLRQFGEGEHEIEGVLAWLLSRLKGFTWNVRGSQRSQSLLRNFDQAQRAFSTLLSELRPLKHLDEGREEFRGLFKSIEVLPSALFQEFDHYRQAKQYLLANQLLVLIPLGTFHMLNNAGRLKQLKDGTLLANANYDYHLGLLPEEADIGAAIF